MTRFSIRHHSWLGITNTFLAIVFNRLLVKITNAEKKTTTYKIVKRLDYPGEV